VDPSQERALVGRLRAGERDAFDEVYEWLRDRVLRFLVRLSNRRDLADDLAQEVWLRLARSAPQLAPDTRLTAWLFTVARNLYVSHWRARRVAEQLAGDLLPPAPPAPSPFDDAAHSQTSARVERALAALPDAYREIVLLCAVEGLAPREAADILGIKPEAARQRLARARAMIEATIDPARRYAGGDPS
jgi:RNA polymerase sigma-70 factor (ECF subfamily)